MKTELTEQEQKSFNENLFFRNIEHANPNAQKLANELKNRNQTQDYLRQFALKYGYPIWDKSKILPAKLPGQSSNFSKEDDSVIIVPVLHPAIKEVRTYVEASIKDFTILAVHTANEYQKLKFGADEKEMIGEAERHAIRFMTLNMDVFNYTAFNISDKRLFHGSGDYKDTALIQRTIKLYSKQPTGTTNFAGGPEDNLYYHQICVDIITTTTSYHCTLTGACAGGTCDNCDLCISSSSNTASICEGWWEDIGGGSGGDPGGTTTGGTSGGGGSTGSTTCTGAGTLPVNGREMPCGNNEPGGWTPVSDEPSFPIYYDNAVPPYTWQFVNDDGTSFSDPDPLNQPDFTFDPEDNYETLYPRFTEMVKNLKTFVANNPKVMNALEKWSGFSKQDIINHLTFGSGPKIKIEEMAGRYAWYKKQPGENTLRVRASYVRGLEQAYLERTKEGTAFLLAVSILHEYIHLGTNHNNISEGKFEFGSGFEIDAFNVIVEDTNATEVVVKFSQYF